MRARRLGILTALLTTVALPAIPAPANAATSLSHCTRVQLISHRGIVDKTATGDTIHAFVNAYRRGARNLQGATKFSPLRGAKRNHSVVVLGNNAPIGFEPEWKLVSRAATRVGSVIYIFPVRDRHGCACLGVNSSSAGRPICRNQAGIGPRDSSIHAANGLPRCGVETVSKLFMRRSGSR